MKKLVLFLAVVAALCMLASCEKYESKITPLDGTSLSTYSAMVDNVELMGLQTADGKHITEPLFSSCEVNGGIVKATYAGEQFQQALYDVDGKVIQEKGYVQYVSRPDELSYYKLSGKGDDYLYFPAKRAKVGPVRGTVINVDSMFIEYRVDKLYGLLTYESVDVLDELASRIYIGPDFAIARCGDTYKKYDMTGKFLGTKLSQSDINFIKEANARANSWKKK